ncbi:MAG: glutamate--tRNA ligase [Oscillospiraceae bacterium]|jgi:glutamyl-tRNA synthetase|nr:glutamate--tRNA ligase [Oscillospiraceae bacterium]
MHLGVLRTALYAWLFARKHKGAFILRIEDTDRARYVEGAVDVIYNTLETCGLHRDEGPVGETPPGEYRETGDYGPYFQSMRKDLYMKYANELVEKNAAYYCFCPAGKEDCSCRDLIKEITGEPFVIRQKVPSDGSTTFRDEIFGEITVDNAEIEDQVLIKSDGMPTYNFANVVDDHLMEITHIIRGSEFLSSTPKYILLYEALGWEPPVFIHVAPIMRDSNNKLSKRDGDAYFSDFIDKGYLVEAVINYIALLGWSPKGENEFFTLAELVEAFDLDGISKSPAIFDEVKMRVINAHYIRNLTPEKFKELAKPYVKPYICKDGQCSVANCDILFAALQPRTEVLTDITPQIDFIEKPCDYEIDLYSNKKMKTTPEASLPALKEALQLIETYDFTPAEPFFDRDNLLIAFKKLTEDVHFEKVKLGYYLYPLQVALTGKKSAPGGGLDVCIMLGKEESVKRIKTAIERLSQ